jgi:outer membrane protein TolC
MRRLIILLPLIVACSLSSGLQAQTALDRYVQAGLKNNLALQQEEFSLQMSLLALKEARGMFLPSISIEARYSFAGGGRQIDFPVGDLFNPIHGTLNQLLAAQGAAPQFPTNLPNQQIPFLRPREHETKLRVVQPVFQPKILHNRKLQASLNRQQEAKTNAYSRQLVQDIKTAYYTYLKTLRVADILTDTRVLLEENLRVSRSLEANHKVTAEVPLRSEAELLALDRQLAESQKNVTMAAAYFNFLLNRPLDTAIEEGDTPPKSNDYDPSQLLESARRHREEFAQLQAAVEAAGQGIKLENSNWMPAVTAVLDYGFQGEEYRFGKDDDYWMASLVMSWNLYNGGRDRARKARAQLKKRQLEAGLRQLDAQIHMQVTEARQQLEVAKRTLASSEAQRQSRREALRIIARKYGEGMVPQIEFIQAQNQATAANLQTAINRFDVLIQEARLERACALFALNTKGANTTKE